MPRDKFVYEEGDLVITYPDGTTVDPREDVPAEPEDSEER